MKSSLHNSDFLSQQQLEAYLNGTLDPSARSKVEQLLQECELSREAVAGFTAMPAALADISGLQKSIAAKSGMGASKIWLNILGGTVLAGAITAAVIWFNSGNEKQTAALPKNELPVIASAPVENEPPIVLSPQAEHFVNPEAKPQAAAKNNSSVNKDSSAVPQPIVTKPQPMTVKDPPLIEVKPVVPSKPEPGYNASVGFILDLKVTEFEKYKDKAVKVNVPKLTGLSAQYESYDIQAGEQLDDSVRKIPADYYLREGLKSFRDARYGRCIEKMEVLRKNDAADLNAAFYMGVSYVKLEMYGKAIPLLDQILNSPNNVFHEEARWYKALALLGNGQQEAGKQLLGEIAAKEGFYQAKAKAMQGK